MHINFVVRGIFQFGRIDMLDPRIGWSGGPHPQKSGYIITIGMQEPQKPGFIKLIKSSKDASKTGPISEWTLSNKGIILESTAFDKTNNCSFSLLILPPTQQYNNYCF